MRAADACDDRAVRPRGPRQLFDLAKALHAHLDYGVAGFRVQAEQGVRHADLVILVALGFERLSERGKNRVAEFLRRRFAHAACHAHQKRVILAAVIRAHRDHRVQRVGRQHAPSGLHARHLVLRHNSRRARGQRSFREVVPVRALAPNAYEQAAGRGRAAVRHDGGDLRVARQLSQPAQQNTGSDRLHLSSPLL